MKEINRSEGVLSREIKKEFYSKKDVKIFSSNSDILDYERIETEIKKYNIDTIFHLAAIVGSTSCDVSGRTCIRINCEGTYNIAKLCSKYNLYMVHFSSTAIYGAQKMPITELTEKNPQTLYAATKLLSENIAKIMCKNLGECLRKSMRPFCKIQWIDKSPTWFDDWIYLYIR